MDVRAWMKDHILLFDGAFGTWFAVKYEGTYEACELENLVHPERALEIHREYVKAGACAIKTNTFGAYAPMMGGEKTQAEVIRKGFAIAEACRQEAEQEVSQGAEQEASQAAAQEASQETEQEGMQETAGAAEEASAETEPETEPEPTVVRHKQEGKHMVRAGDMTISVPTTFEGLEMEGAEFSGDDVIVRAGQKGSCRMKYRGAFNSIRINVTNNTDYDMAVRECTIWGIEVASQEPDPELSLYGITMGATRQEIADVYGEPFSKTFDDENHMSNMVYQFGEDIHSNQIVMIIFKDKKAVAASYDDFDLVVR